MNLVRMVTGRLGPGMSKIKVFDVLCLKLNTAFKSGIPCSLCFKDTILNFIKKVSTDFTSFCPFS